MWCKHDTAGYAAVFASLPRRSCDICSSEVKFMHLNTLITQPSALIALSGLSFTETEARECFKSNQYEIIFRPHAAFLVFRYVCYIKCDTRKTATGHGNEGNGVCLPASDKVAFKSSLKITFLDQCIMWRYCIRRSVFYLHVQTVGWCLLWLGYRAWENKPDDITVGKSASSVIPRKQNKMSKVWRSLTEFCFLLKCLKSHDRSGVRFRKWIAVVWSTSSSELGLRELRVASQLKRLKLRVSPFALHGNATMNM